MKQFDPMTYLPGMEQIDSDIMPQVTNILREFSPETYTGEDVSKALLACEGNCSPQAYAALLSPAAVPFLEEMARAAQHETRRWFGNSVSLYTPLYIANYCENHCTYCGFSCHHKIKRGKLSLDEIRREAEMLAATGLEEILVLTGECRSQSSVEYIGEAITLLKDYFAVIGIEIYPLNINEYRHLQLCGADYVSIYQETYDLALYEQLHVSGPKRCYPYRFYSAERAFMGGMRGVSFGALLGLGDFRRDCFAAGLHAYFTQKKYPQAEVAFSFPRIRPVQGEAAQGTDVTERNLLQAMLAARLFMPFAGITVSTRERPGFRDAAAGLTATKISAGVSVGVGGHSDEQKGDPQFVIADDRSVAEIRNMLAQNGLQPVFLDYIRV